MWVDEMSENRFPDFYSYRLSSLSKHDPVFLSFSKRRRQAAYYYCCCCCFWRLLLLFLSAFQLKLCLYGKQRGGATGQAIIANGSRQTGLAASGNCTVGTSVRVLWNSCTISTTHFILNTIWVEKQWLHKLELFKLYCSSVFIFYIVDTKVALPSTSSMQYLKTLTLYHIFNVCHWIDLRLYCPQCPLCMAIFAKGGPSMNPKASETTKSNFIFGPKIWLTIDNELW